VDLASLYCFNNLFTSLDLSKNVDLESLDCSSNKLSNLNLKNAKNTVLTNAYILNFSGNPNLTCIQVDDAAYSNSNWAGAKDTTASYSENCNSLYTLIPDPNFEQKLIDLGIDKDGKNGKVATESIASLTSLDVSSSSISDLTGIQDFVALQTLDCQKNNVTTLDVSNNGNLTTVNCSRNQLTNFINTSNPGLTNLNCSTNKLTSLDVSKYASLTNLSFTGNKITTINVSSNNMLQKLSFSGNLIAELDVTNNTSLKELNCSGNLLTNLNVTKNVNLEYFYCFSNQITSLDVSQNINLLGFMCNSNNIKTIDVSNNPKLDFFDCLNNSITSLDLSKNPLLTELACENNQLTYLNLKNGANTILDLAFSNFVNNPNLTCILVDDVSYSNTNWTNIKDTTANYSTDCTPYTLIPDSSFEQKLIDLGIDTDGLNGKITVGNFNSITILDLSNSNIKDLKGIENFTALSILICSNNQLTALDLSKNTNLQILILTGNPLAYLNLRNGNNKNLILKSLTGRKTTTTEGTSFLGIPTLGCIKVDDAAYSNANWSAIKEATTVYSETCTLGLEDSAFNKAVLYPNPTKGELNILNIALEKATVYNSLGQLVKTFSLDPTNTNHTINLSGLPKGIYFVYLINQDAASAKKIIVE
jgi:Leucine-rich repeat (LRR) protein